MQPWPKYSLIAVLRSAFPKNGYLGEIILGHSVVGECVTVGASVDGEIVTEGSIETVGEAVTVGPDVGLEESVGAKVVVGTDMDTLGCEDGIPLRDGCAEVEGDSDG